jgi:phosphatidylglycerophosphate synthase
MGDVVEGVVLAVPAGSRGAGKLVSPDQQVAGLPLTLRAILTLQAQGLERVIVAIRPELRVLAESFAADARVRASVDIVTVERGAAALPVVRKALKGSFVLARYDRIVEPSLYASLRDGLCDGEGDTLGVVLTRGAEPLGPFAGKRELLDDLDDSDDQLSGLAARDDVAELDLGAHWAFDVNDSNGRRGATRELFEACRKPVDGVVSRYFNRHVSLFVSKLLVNTPVTPNAMTAATFAVSVLAAWFALDGSYETTVVAAVLMQLNSILDGCDGELARVRFQGSKLGQWLDTIGDDASNVLFWAALGFGARVVPDHGWWLAIAGWVAAGANALAALQNYILLARKGSGDFYALQSPDTAPPSGWVGKLVAFFNVVLKQDFFLFLCMWIAVAGYLHQLLPLMAVGAVVTLGASTARMLRQR